MKVRMKEKDRRFIKEYNYPEKHQHQLMYGSHEVLERIGSCYKIKIDGCNYFVSRYDMEPINGLPDDLFVL